MQEGGGEMCWGESNTIRGNKKITLEDQSLQLWARYLPFINVIKQADLDKTTTKTLFHYLTEQRMLPKRKT